MKALPYQGDDLQPRGWTLLHASSEKHDASQMQKRSKLGLGRFNTLRGKHYPLLSFAWTVRHPWLASIAVIDVRVQVCLPSLLKEHTRLLAAASPGNQTRACEPNPTVFWGEFDYLINRFMWNFVFNYPYFYLQMLQVCTKTSATAMCTWKLTWKTQYLTSCTTVTINAFSPSSC